ncbi:MAG: hypothetical protein LIP28_05895 [Deltaproteobacteria bacterium]|nr:hypothetical protein [Deltaproteobacteria bacterium]
MGVIFPEETKVVRAVRRFCLDCQGGQTSLVRECAEEDCPLHPWRLPDAAPYDEAHGRVLRAVRRHCLNCAGDRKEARSCDAEDSCPLWAYRFGVHPVTYKRVSLRVRAPKDLFLPGFEARK